MWPVGDNIFYLHHKKIYMQKFQLKDSGPSSL